jgi:YHS domain-containing protein
VERRLQRLTVMKGRSRRSELVAVAVCLLIISCGRSAPQKRRGAATTTEVQTVESVDPRPVVLDPPPVLIDEGPAPKPKGNVVQKDAPPPPSAQDEALRASLPFAPAIAMDPVDGSKISIRAGTPVAEFKGHIYYFSSDANKRTFLANPDQYTKGVFSHL